MPRPVWIALLLALGGAAAQASGLQTLAPSEATSLSRMFSLPVMAVLVGGLFMGTLAISRFSLKLGVPTVLGVLLLGLFINTNATLFSNETIAWLHTLSLSMLLFYAGLRTELRSIRGFLEYGVVLAVGGVVVSSLLLGLIVWYVSSPTAGGIELGFGQMPLAAALLIAACLGSTDAGATIGVLASLPKRLPPRLQALLEFESSVNDPAAILFLSVVVGLFTMAHGQGGGEGLLIEQMRMFLQKIGSGLVVGVILGYGARFSLEYLVHRQEELLILGVAIALLSYGVAELLEGSGFIAAYATGMFMSNHVYRNARVTPEALLQTMLPFNTMTEIVVFLIFGLAMHPRQMLDSMPEGIAIALGMMLIARPISVLLFQKLSPFSLKESLLIAWCGLRGAVPLALSFEVIKAIPNVKGIDQSLVPALVANAEVIVFCVVVLNLLIQGLSLPHLCRALGIGETSPIGEPGEAAS